jgi:hypothetical protein
MQERSYVGGTLAARASTLGMSAANDSTRRPSRSRQSFFTHELMPAFTAALAEWVRTEVVQR